MKNMNIRKEGFSLLEVLIASLIMVIGIVGLVPAFNAGVKNSSRAKMWTDVALLAQEKIEEIKANRLDIFSGQKGKYTWNITKGDANLSGLSKGALQRYELIIQWQDGTKLRKEKFVYLKK